MLKRLLTAVLILAIFVVFTGTAFSAPSNHGVTKEKLPINTQNSPKFKTPPMYKATSTPEALPPHAAVTNRPAHPAAPAMIDTTICGASNYVDWDNATYFYSWPRRSNSAGSREFAMRYDGPQLPGFKIKVNGLTARVLYAHEGTSPGPQDGMVHAKVSVYNALAGNPGSLVYTQTFAIPVFTSAPLGTQIAFNFTTPPVVAGDYFISLKADPTQPSSDTLCWVSDDAGVYTATPSFRLRVESGALPGVWQTGPGLFGGTSNFNMDFESDWCQVYSSCYTAETPSNGFVSYLGFPNVTWSGNAAILKGIGQTFSSAGPDTVKSVTISHLCLADGAYDSTSTNAVLVQIWKDNGAGNIDTVAGPLASATIPSGIASLFPFTADTTADFEAVTVNIPSMPVVMGPWHVTASMTSSNPADGVLYFLINSPSNDPGRTGGSVAFTAPGKQWERTGTSVDWGFGEFAWFFDVNLCSDEFSNCQTQILYDQPPAFLYTMRPAGVQSVAQKVIGPDVNRIDKIRFAVGHKNGTNVNLKINVFADGGVDPGALLASYTVAPNFSGWTEVVIPGGFQTYGNFFVGYDNVTLVSGDTIRAETDDGTGPYINGGARLMVGGVYYSTEDLFGPGDQENLVAEVDFCSIPPTKWPCDPTKLSSPTAGVDFGRTGHSNVAVGDAYCKMTTKWKYHDPNFATTAGLINANPITFGNFVVCGFTSSYKVFDLTTGALLRTITGSGSPDYIQFGSLNCTPTIAKITISGTPTNVLFIGGGNTGGVNAYNMDVAGIPLIWTLANSNASTFMGFPTDPGNTALVNFVVLNISGTDMLFFADGSPYVWACNAATGQYIWGPIALLGAPFRGMATDGTNLFVTTTAAPPGIPNGDVYSIKASNGAINWQLTTAAGGGLKGGVVYSSFANETFPDGVAYNNGELYLTSATMATPTFPADGVLYYLNSTTGAVKKAVATVHVPCYGSSGNLIQSTPLVDANQIVVTGYSTWVTPPLGGTTLSYNRFTANLHWVAPKIGDYATSNGFRGSDATMTCEPDGNEFIFQGSIFGYLSCLDASTGLEVFNRRVDNIPNTNDGAVDRQSGTAIGQNGEVIATSRYGEVYCLSKQADRPRLEIVNYFPSAPTYGPLPSILLDYGPVFTNTGCLPLTGSYTIDSALHAALGVPRNNNQENNSAKAASIANLLTSNSDMAWKYAGITTPNDEITAPSKLRTMNRAAAAGPLSIVNNVGPYPFTLNPGDTGHIIVDMKQNVIDRGPHVFYAYFNSNDPDFFINNVTEIPYVQVMCIGGCITDSTTMHFGSSSANWVTVYNNGRVATSKSSYDVDGFTDDVFQGTYVYGVTKNRIALNVVPWQSGSTENEAWVSLQADPNLCNSNCKPALTTGISLGTITTTGTPYVPLTGNVVCRTYLDSVQNFATGFSSWLWDNTPALFDADSTMGLMTNSRTVAFVNAPAGYTDLNNVVVDFQKIYPRYGQAVPNWKMGVVVDYDLGKDSAGYNGGSSVAYDAQFATATRTTGGYAWVKLPYGGCGATFSSPLINSKALNEDQALFNSTAAVRDNGYLDSVYQFMSLAPGGYGQSVTTGGSDQAFHATFIKNNFAGNDTLQFALAHLCLTGLVNPKLAASYASLSHLLNKWVGYDRGDANNDGAVNIADIVYLAAYVNGAPKGPIPFVSVGDVNADGAVNALDVTYLINYYFFYGPCPVGKLITY